MNIDFPLHLDGRGRTATTDHNDHIRDLIEQLLFTNPGERVNRPTFGSGLLTLVFEPNSPELAAAHKVSVQASLQNWLDDLIVVHKLNVESEQSALLITLEYSVRQTGERQTAQFVRAV